MRIKLFHMTILFGHKGAYIFESGQRHSVLFISSSSKPLKLLAQLKGNTLGKLINQGRRCGGQNSTVIQDSVKTPFFQGGISSFHQFFLKTTQTSCTTQRKHIGETYQQVGGVAMSAIDRDSRFGDHLGIRAEGESKIEPRFYQKSTLCCRKVFNDFCI